MTQLVRRAGGSTVNVADVDPPGVTDPLLGVIEETAAAAIVARVNRAVVAPATLTRFPNLIKAP